MENFTNLTREQSNFHYNTEYHFDAGVGLSENTVRYISEVKKEEPWLLEFRLNALKKFFNIQLNQDFIPKIVKDLDFSRIRYYLAQKEKSQRSWDDVPEDVKNTFERLGVPENERKFLAGVEAQFDSEAAYYRIKNHLSDQGVIFVDSTEGLKKYPEIFKKYFASVVNVADNKFSALNSAVFSGGSFIYVPKGIKITQPLQAYFRINAENFGQFERTLIIVDEGAELTYLEGCTAPKFTTDTLHSAVVELVALKCAKIQYITIQNWSNNVFNLVTKRGFAYENAEIRWIDCNIGSRVTMKYPAVYLKGENAKGEVISIAVASDGQYQDTGARMLHFANNTTSNVIAKSVSIGSGLAVYRGDVRIAKNLENCKNNVCCDALLLGEASGSDTFPKINLIGNQNIATHEASVSRISDEQILYMRQRGLTEKEATSLSVNGFINELVKNFPIEYSVELKRLIELETGK